MPTAPTPAPGEQVKIVGVEPGRRAVGLRHALLEAVDRARLDQADGAAAEAAAGHARAEDAGDRRGDVDHHVDLAAADLEVVAHADVRFGHQPPDEREIAGLERVGGAHRAVVLGDDVAAAAVDDRRQQAGVALELRRG